MEEMHSLLVSNLSRHTRTDDLYRLFDRYGEVGDVYIPRDRRSGQQKTFAFVRFYKHGDAEYALRADGRDLIGNRIKVQLAQYGKGGTFFLNKKKKKFKFFEICLL